MNHADDLFDSESDAGQFHSNTFQHQARSPPGAGPTASESHHTGCPRCQSPQAERRHNARRIAGLIGTLAGAAQGAARVLQGSEIGLTIGAAVAGPPGAGVGAAAGAVLAGLLGATTGCVLGVKLGEAIDNAVLDTYRCLACGHTFSTAPQPER